MNLTEALHFNTKHLRQEVENTSIKEQCDIYYPMVACEVIDLLMIELTRLYKIEANDADSHMDLNSAGFVLEVQH